MRQVSHDRLIGLLAAVPPCISIYQPTHRRHPDDQQDPIRFRNLVRHVETLLSERYPTRHARPILERLQAVGRDDRFWTHRTDGLAVFASLETFEVFELQRPVRELLVVADSFHVKPLIRIVQSADRYQILSLSRQKAKLYEGNRDALDQVELIGTPSTIGEALGENLARQPHQIIGTYGVKFGGGGKAPHHGHESQSDQVETNRDRFFRLVDRGIFKHHSRPSGLPLLLAALPESHEPFRRISHNPFLLPDGIATNPDPLRLDELRERAWKEIEPFYLARLEGLKERFFVALSQQAGSADISDVAKAAVAGGVETLLVEADRVIPGALDRTSGAIELGAQPSAHVDDLLDDVAELVLAKGGDVVVAPAERMPTTTGLAAIYRF
jgi:hypothetical protein